MTDGWTAYLGLSAHGYIHHRVIHSREFVVRGRPWIHTQTIERLWGVLKDVSLRRGFRKEYLKEALGRFVFLSTFSEQGGLRSTALHELLILLGKKHRHPLVSFN